MDEIAALKSLGLQWPTPAYLFGAIVFGVVGLVAFRSGRKSGHAVTAWLGVALMFYPYFVSPTWLLYAVGAALCTGIWFDQR